MSTVFALPSPPNQPRHGLCLATTASALALADKIANLHGAQSPGKHALTAHAAGKSARQALQRQPGRYWPGLLAGAALLATGAAHAQCVTPLQDFAYSGAIASYTVPNTADYWIEAAGAEGGNSGGSNYRPGRGAVVGGKFHLTAGTALQVLVGQQPSLTRGDGNGGGGGSFVVVAGSNPPHALAVGGGGAGSASLDHGNKHGQALSAGGNGTNTIGGTDGNGGLGGASNDFTSGGGGGLLSNGADAYWESSVYPAGAGQAFINGGAGGNMLGTIGGFGGGGSGSSFSTSGGGGGYSGGGAAIRQSGIGGMGGGGGSFNSGADPMPPKTGEIDGQSGHGAVKICLTDAPASMVAAPVASGTEGIGYGPVTLSATGGLAPYTWSAANLPDGMVLNASTGVLSGTPVTGAAGSYTFTASDTYTPTPHTATVTWVIAPAPIAITTTTLQPGMVGASYTAPVAATGGLAPLVWSVAGLPAGLAMDSVTGEITGTPTEAGSFNITVTATDKSTPTALTASKPLTLVIAPAPIDLTVLTPATLPPATAGQAYSTSIAVQGGEAPYRFSVTAGSLPAGLALDGATGTITGTPTLAGDASFSITVDDNTVPKAASASTSANAKRAKGAKAAVVSVTQAFSLSVAPAAVAATPTPVPTLHHAALALLSLMAAAFGGLALRWKKTV